MRCPREAAPGAASPDLYCIDLTPTGAAGGASGTAWLLPADSPFGASVSAEGVHRWDLDLALEGLPEPGSLGPYRTYVVWAAAPVLRPIVRLGAATNGRVRLGPLELNQFLILVSAEASADVAERRGPLVLRGASASTRLQPHDFGRVLAEATAGPPASPEPPGPAGSAHRTHEGTSPDGSALAWPAAPMHPGVSMPSALMRLRPDVSPFLPGAPTAAPPEPARPAALVELADGDTLALVAQPVLRTLKGRTHVVYGFNGTWPGPLVRVPRDATIVVLFQNLTEWPTAVHWHGVRLDNRFDGVPGVTQDPVPPGGRFTYRVRFPDAGLYWYHPHHRADVQQDLGLYGNIRVVEPSAAAAPVHREEVLLLDDLLATDGGLVPWGREAATHALMGRFGNVLLVNGEPGWDLRVDRGAVVRFHLTNASSARVFNVSFDGAPTKVVATDLSPFEREERVESVVIAPAERYVVDVRFPEQGTYALVNGVQAIDPWRGRFLARSDTLGVVRVGSRPAAPDLRAPFETLRVDSALLSEVRAHRAVPERPPDHELVLALETGDLPFPMAPLLALESVYAHPVDWSDTMPEMNAAATARGLRWVLRDAATGAEDEAIAWRFRTGELVRIRLVNDRGALHAMHHAIHVHGQRFLVLSRNGRRTPNLAWKDTLLLPAGETAEILLELSNPGRWMLHCHTAEHLEAGMRTVFTVDSVPSSTPRPR